MLGAGGERKRDVTFEERRGDDEDDEENEGEIEQRRDVEFRHGAVAGTLGITLHGG